MRAKHRVDARRLVVAALAAICGALGLSACFDLFHSTDDVLTGCQIDAQAAGCALEASARPLDAADGGGAE